MDAPNMSNERRKQERATLSQLLGEEATLQRLKLPDTLESAYDKFHREAAVRQTRAYWPVVVISIIIVGALLFASGLVPPNYDGLVGAGIALCLLLYSFVIVAAQVESLQRWLRLSVGLASILALTLVHVGTMLVKGLSDLHVIAQLSVVVVTIAAFTLANLLFREAIFCWLVATGSVLILQQVSDLQVKDDVFWGFYTFASLIVGFILSFTYEIRDRTMFLQGRLLSLEKQEIDVMALELERLSRTDPLTGLPNRRAFDEALLREWGSCMREAQPIGLLLIDVDHFKAFNDLYGHVAGDHCLSNVAKVLAIQKRRPADCLGRFGGEEFICLFPRTDRDGLAKIAERIKDAIDCLAIPHATSSAGGFVSVSIGGVVLTPELGQVPIDLVLLADKALYAAKDQGRRRCVMAWELVS